MARILPELDAYECRRLAANLSRGTLSMFCRGSNIERSVLRAHVAAVRAYFEEKALKDGDIKSEQHLFEMLSEERSIQEQQLNHFRWVFSPSESDENTSLQTSKVTCDLVKSAEHTIDIATYNLPGSRTAAPETFQLLDDCLLNRKQVKVRLFIGVIRQQSEAVETHVAALKKSILRLWPYAPRPLLYLDHASLSKNKDDFGLQHAKLWIADQKRALVTSANFSYNAQEKNIEAGMLIEHEPSVRRLSEQLERFIGTRFFPFEVVSL